MADEKHHHGFKSLKERWRSKSNPDEPRSNSKQEQNVADFLRPSSIQQAQPQQAQVPLRPRPSAPSAPKIDIAAAQRWAGNTADQRAGNGLATPSSLRGRGNSVKKPRRPNLKVAFSDLEDIIGEGGEGCDDATVVISRQQSQRRAGGGGIGGIPRGQENVPLQPQDSLRSMRNARTPPPGAQPPSIDNYDDDDDLHPGYSNQLKADAATSAAYRQLVGDEPQDSPPSKSHHPYEDNFRPKPLARTATGFHTRGSMSSMYSDEESPNGSPEITKPPINTQGFKLPEFNSVMDNSPLDFGFDKPRRADTFELTRSPVEMQDKIHRMRMEEGRVLHQNVRRSVIELAEDILPIPKEQPAPSASEAIYDMYGQAYSPNSPEQVRNRDRSQSRESPTRTGYQPPTPYSTALEREPRLPVLPPTYQNPPPPAGTPSPNPIANPADIHPYRKPVPPQHLPPPTSAPAPPSTLQGKPSPSPLTIPSKDYFGSDPQSAVSSRTQPFRTPTTATSVRTPASAMAQVAYEDFGHRCSHMWGIFRLQAEFERPIQEYTPSQWLRAAGWWFIKGRTGLEQLIRSRPKTPDGATSGAKQELLTQPHVDLAKCWWILSEILPMHRGLPANTGLDPTFPARASAAAANNDMRTADFFDNCEIVVSNLRAVISSMNKNGMMPPLNALIQGQDQTIWIPYPQFPSDLLPILSGNTSRSLTERATIRTFDPLSVMAVADTKNDFSYYRWFVKVTLGTGDDHEEPISMLCLFSVMRTRNDWHPKVAICSQKELLTICVTGDRKQGPSWEDVKWSETDASLQILLPHGYILNAQLNRPDYQTFVGMYKKAYTVQTSLFPMEDETIIFETQLADFQYSDTLRPPAFPLERQKRCRVRLLVKEETRQEGKATRKFYRGLRVLITTSPKNRTLASASHELNIQLPIIIEMLTENTPSGESFPAMALHIKEDHRDVSLFMVFAQLRERQALYAAFNQAEVSKEETQFAAVRLKKMTIEPAVDIEMRGPQNPLQRMQWQELLIINKDPEDPTQDIGQTIQSNNLRIIAQGAGGTITDRVNIGSGELRLRLAPDGTNTVTVLRQPQDDLSMIFDRRAAPFTPEQVEELHQAIFQVPTKRTFHFYNAADLHAFQESITGFKVKFDGLARSFTISRRRPVTALSKHKKLEAGLTRIQIVSHDNDKIVQLIAFFDHDFTHAESIGFVLKSVDNFERYNDGKHGAKHGVRFVDAKFTLPKHEKSGRHSAMGRQEDLDRPYVSLDMPDYPAENDDIWIGFDEEEEREKFLQTLPAPVATQSRGMASRLGMR